MGDYFNFYIIYFFVAVMAILDAFFLSLNKARVVCFFLVLCLFVVIGFRGEFDSDYAAYSGIYDAVIFYDFDSFISSFRLNVEPLFVLTIIFLKFFTFGPQAIFIVCAFFSLSINWYYCLRWVPYPSLVILGLLSHSFLYREFTEIRHGVAGALCVASFFLLSSGRTRKAFVLQLIALLFHSASLFVISFSILFCSTSRKNFILICTGLGAILFFLGIHNLLEIANNLMSLPGSVTIYFQSEYDYNLGLLNPTFIKQSILIVFFFACSKYLKIKEERYLNFLCFYYVSVMWLFGANEFAMFAGRLASFFGVLEVYLFSMTLPYIRSKALKLSYIFLVIFVYAFQFYLNIEYKNIFLGDYIFF
ncbi:EpsG family protein [Paraherbaspirillum soli]|uniref:EpsG family protein n=1 Tax=Paraherbaspirillum soli TaxID=631222 RepID=A0ABW0MD61_9BURK